MILLYPAVPEQLLNCESHTDPPADHKIHLYPISRNNGCIRNGRSLPRALSELMDIHVPSSIHKKYDHAMGYLYPVTGEEMNSRPCSQVSPDLHMPALLEQHQHLDHLFKDLSALKQTGRSCQHWNPDRFLIELSFIYQAMLSPAETRYPPYKLQSYYRQYPIPSNNQEPSLYFHRPTLESRNS